MCDDDDTWETKAFAAAGLALILFAFFMAMAAGKARGQNHEHGHAMYHDFYKEWKQPHSDSSCCNARKTGEFGVIGDCYPTEFRLVAGKWQALRAKEDGGGWIDLPEEKRIHEKNPDSSGRAGHLCYNMYTHEVLCFVPPVGVF